MSCVEDTGPPEMGRPRPAGARRIRKSTLQTPSYRYAAGLRRRRDAANVLVPLAGGGRDPWWYGPCGPRGYEAAASHLLERGLTPAPDREGLRVMWSRGGHHRTTAQLVVARWEMNR